MLYYDIDFITDMARKAAEYKLQKSLEKQRLKDMAQRIKHMKGMFTTLY